MNFLRDVERILLANVAKVYNELKTIDDKTMTGLAFFYGYDILLHALGLLEHTKRLILYHTTDNPPRRLYHFFANKNQEEILRKEEYFACPHNIAVKLYEEIFRMNNDIDIERFDVSHEYLIDKMTKLIEQSCENLL